MPLFLLSGVPGSGKSSVARALMQRFPYGLHIPVDDLREWVVSGIAHPVPTWTDETTRQFRLARQSAALMARSYFEAGFAVVIDDVIFPNDTSGNLDRVLTGLPVRRVLLLPPVEVALERNARRTHKDFDTSVLDGPIRSIHSAMMNAPWTETGWTIVDNGALSIDATVDLILNAVH